MSLIITRDEEFIDSRILTLDTKIEASNKKSLRKGSNEKCYNCKNIDPSISNCPHFKKLSSQKRWNIKLRNLMLVLHALKKDSERLTKIKKKFGVQKCKRRDNNFAS